MTATLSQPGFDQQSFDAFLHARNEPAWLVEQRREAWQSSLEKDWPARNEEEWMRTDIRLFKLNQFGLPVGPHSVWARPGDKVGDHRQDQSHTESGTTLTEGVDLAGRTAAEDSRPAHSALKAKWADKGVVFGSLDELVHTHGELIRKHLFTRAVDPTYDKFSALHAACWSGGHLLYVPRNVTIEEPLHCLSAISDGGVDLGHTLIVLEENAEATVMCETASPRQEDSGFHCGATEVILAPNSRLRFVSLQNWGHGVWHFAHQKAIVGRDASLQWTLAAIGSRLSKVNQHVELVGRGASTQVNGVLFTEGKQHISYHTLQHHAAPDCRSDFLYKSALQDKSRTVWRGMIKVDPLAIKTNGYQRNDNLLLAATARADSIPGLEIQCDDVRCTHGSTTGKVDEELIFYAQARGLTRKEATRLIVSGFFQQIFDRITIESVREALGQAILRRVREYV
ncbi:MAG: Fe-S cluster assembly protein SufD [Planctomycetaceae bacterium]|nr:Fe-S cluster assembly protein SufD [Planctomycetaceae bacterium]